MNKIAMIPFEDQHLDMVRIWRNDPEVREICTPIMKLVKRSMNNGSMSF